MVVNMHKLSAKSKAKLVGVHPSLVAIVERAIQITTVDFAVIEGVRDLARQQELYAQGRTKPGKIVTWTLNSRHFKDASGFGKAVDLLPVTGWNDVAGFDAVAKAMQDAAKELNLAVRWGADWDQDGKPREKGELDSPHFELVE